MTLWKKSSAESSSNTLTNYRGIRLSENSYHAGCETFIEVLFVPHSHLDDGIYDFRVKYARELLGLSPLLHDTEYYCEFNVVFQGLLHRVPMLDGVIGVVLGDLLDKKPCIKLGEPWVTGVN
jgi:hypothetical protein